MKHCTIDGCTKNYLARGCCSTHYWRWNKYGDPNYKVKEYEHHGMWKTPLYAQWLAIKQRTTNPSSNGYEYYGGRGIKMCQGWSESFQSFSQDIGQKPSQTHSLDRRDNNGNYSCGKCTECKTYNWSMNVRWATKSQQSVNQRLSYLNKSGYRGVCFQHNRYTATINFFGIQIYLGRFTSATEAAQAYNDMAVQLHGKDANINVL